MKPTKKKRREKIVLIWHEAFNIMATFEKRDSGLPLLVVVDDDYKGINPFYAYPQYWLLKHFGWIKIGEL